MLSKSGKLRVAAITREGDALRHLRLLQPLQSLYLSGEIAGYNVFSDGTGQGPHEFEAYDVIWIQRNGPGSIRFVKWLNGAGLNYMLDVDDLLLTIPSYSAAFNYNTSLIKLLQGCRVLSASNGRLVSNLEKYSGLELVLKSMLTPNGLRFPHGTCPEAKTPNALIWTSSDNIALTRSYESVVNAIIDFSARHKLPIYLAGSFPARFKENLKNGRFLGFMDFWEHKSFLANQTTMMAVCPLETDADEKTIDFIESKSDVKVVEYSGFSHPGVYSDCLPYTDTDLNAGFIASNTYESWSSTLERCLDEGAQFMVQQTEAVRMKRGIEKLSSDCWLPALRKAALEKPIAHPVLAPKIKQANRDFLNRATALVGPLMPECVRKVARSVLGKCLNRK